MGRSGLTAPLRRRDFRLLWAGLAISLLGDGVFIVAVAWQAYTISNHPATLAYVGVATSIPQLVMLLVGGAVADRLERRVVLVLADLARFAAVGLLGVLTATHTVGLVELYGAAIVIGVATAFANPALDAIIPDLVAAEELKNANAVGQFIRPISLQLLGPALGGAAVAALHPAGAFAFDAATFAISALCVAAISRRNGERVAATRTASVSEEIGEGLAYVRRHIWLWGTFLSATVSYLCFIGPTEVLLPYAIRNELHRSAATYGLVLTLGGIGAIVGALVASRRHGRSITPIFCAWTLATFAVAGYGIAHASWGFAVVAFTVNGGEAAGAVLWSTLKQRRVERTMLGRVSSIDWAISTALLPLSYALTAPIAAAIGTRETLVLAGTVGGIATFGFLFLPGLRAEVPDALDPSTVGPVGEERITAEAGHRLRA